MTQLFLEALMFFIAALTGIFALFVFIECQHVKAERQQKRHTERLIQKKYGKTY